METDKLLPKKSETEEKGLVYNLALKITCLLLLCVGVPAHAGSFLIQLSPIPPMVNEKTDDGILLDLAHELQRVIPLMSSDVTVDVRIKPWKRALADMDEQANVFMLQMVRTPTREAKYHWIDQTSALNFAFATPGTRSIDTLEDAKSAERILVYSGSHLETFLRSQGFDQQIEPVRDSTIAGRMFSARRATAWYATMEEVGWLHKRGVISIPPTIGKPIQTMNLWAIASKKTKELERSIFSAALAKVKMDGRFTEILARYTMPSG